MKKGPRAVLPESFRRRLLLIDGSLLRGGECLYCGWEALPEQAFAHAKVCKAAEVTVCILEK
jgi:hypothetical protein